MLERVRVLLMELKLAFSTTGEVAWFCALCTRPHVAVKIEGRKSLREVLTRTIKEALSGNPGVIANSIRDADAKDNILLTSRDDDKLTITETGLLALLETLPLETKRAFLKKWFGVEFG